jgi:hypothetical protein
MHAALDEMLRMGELEVVARTDMESGSTGEPASVLGSAPEAFQSGSVERGMKCPVKTKTWNGPSMSCCHLPAASPSSKRLQPSRWTGAPTSDS